MLADARQRGVVFIGQGLTIIPGAMAQFRRIRGAFQAMELGETNIGCRAFFPMRDLEKKGRKMKNNLFKLALAATMVALTTISASAAGIGIIIGPSYRDHHRHHFTHHRICHFRFGHRHCFWR